MLDEICRRCLRGKDEGRHRPHCRGRSCPDCYAPAGDNHRNDCPRWLSVLERHLEEEYGGAA